MDDTLSLSTYDGDNGNVTSNITAYPDIISIDAVRYALITVHVTASVIAIIGNALVLYVVLKNKALRRNPTVIFILNLAFCDFVQCFFYRPLQLLDLILPFTQSWHFEYDTNYCRTMTFFQCLFAAVGFHTIVVISQERLFLIVHPLKAKLCCNTSKARKLLVAIWIMSVLFILPIPLVFTRILEQIVGGVRIKFCGVFTESKAGPIVYYTLMVLIYFVIPLVIISISYTRIFFALYHRPQNLDVHEKKEFKILRRRRSLAKMMVSVAIIFGLCWGPHFCFYAYAGLGGRVESNGFFTAAIMDILPIFSSCLNPFVYTLNSRTFRTGVRNLLSGSIRSRRSRTESTFNTFLGTYRRQSSIPAKENDTFIRPNQERKVSLVGKRTMGDVMI